MSFEIQQLPHPVAAPAPEGEILGPKNAAFAQAFADVLEAEGLIDAAAIARARRAAEVASERLDLVLVKLGLISESDLCVAYASYCKLPLVGGTMFQTPSACGPVKTSFSQSQPAAADFVRWAAGNHRDRGSLR
jgi:hypothetical protein